MKTVYKLFCHHHHSASPFLAMVSQMKILRLEFLIGSWQIFAVWLRILRRIVKYCECRSEIYNSNIKMHIEIVSALKDNNKPFIYLFELSHRKTLCKYSFILAMISFGYSTDLVYKSECMATMLNTSTCICVKSRLCYLFDSNTFILFRFLLLMASCLSDFQLYTTSFLSCTSNNHVSVSCSSCFFVIDPTQFIKLSMFQWLRLLLNAMIFSQFITI